MSDSPEIPEVLPPRFREALERMMRRELSEGGEGHPAPPDPPAARVAPPPAFKGDPTLSRTMLRGKDARPVGKIVSRRLSEVEPRDYDWLWPGRIAFGEPVLYYGDCDQGKSLLSIALAAAVTSGTNWPDSPTATVPRGSVAFLQDEDSVEETLRPRVDAAGGDPARIHALDCVAYEGDHYDLFSIPRHAAELEYWLAEHRDVRLLVIDPVTAYLGGADMGNDAEVRSMVIRPLAALSRKRRVAVVLIGHVNKGANPKATYRAMGSAALVNAPRAAFFVATDPDDEGRRLVAPAKFNLGVKPSGLAYRFHGASIRWEAETIPGLTANGLLARERSSLYREEGEGKRGPRPTIGKQCDEWVSDQIDHGPALLAELVAKGEKLGFARASIDRSLRRKKAVGFERDGVKFYGKAPALPGSEGTQ